jgi:hypothetical protein
LLPNTLSSCPSVCFLPNTLYLKSFCFSIFRAQCNSRYVSCPLTWIYTFLGNKINNIECSPHKKDQYRK